MPTLKRTGFFITTLVIISLVIMNYEMFKTIIYTKDVHRGDIPFKGNNYVKELAYNDLPAFFKSQAKAGKSRIVKIFSAITSAFLSAIIVCLILQKSLQKVMIKIIDAGLGPIKSDFRDLKKEEGNYITIICSIILFSRLIHQAVFSKHSNTVSICESILLWFGCYFILFPLGVFGTYWLFKKFGKNMIVGYYISSLLFVFYEFTSIEDVDYKKMKKIDASIFPPLVQRELKNYYLFDKVYEEISYTKDKNAALVGYGAYRRIEIYGKFLLENEEGLYAVMLHEIGHAFDNSLFKKVIMYVFLLCCEMILFIIVYVKIAPNFQTNLISKFTAFALLSIVYILFVKQWLFAVFKFVSQNAETQADKFAKTLGYGRQLGGVLFDIVIEANEYLAPSFLYNIFRSTHPPISDRVNFLGN
ncbi:putative CAAX prenyl protease 1 [Cucumispora dikerogammari]|nr:putative CAAX prenyl protease 1 [Cucumispora dikerogammari]